MLNLHQGRRNLGKEGNKQEVEQEWVVSLGQRLGKQYSDDEGKHGNLTDDVKCERKHLNGCCRKHGEQVEWTEEGLLKKSRKEQLVMAKKSPSLPPWRKHWK